MQLTDEMVDAHLATWESLNAALRLLDREEPLHQLLDAELHGKRRGMFVFRVHARLNKVRADRERRELRKEVGDGAAAKISTFKGLS